MPNKDIIKMLARTKRVTGDDIGRLLITDMAEEYRSYMATGKVKSIITQSEFNDLLKALKDNLQIDRYNNYVSLHNTIKTYSALNKTNVKTITARIGELRRVIDTIRGSIQTRIALEEMPLVLTQAKYDELMKEYEPDKTEEYCYLDIFLNTATLLFHTYRELIDLDVERNPEVDAIISKYEKEPVKSLDLQRAHRAYFEENKLEDGEFKFKGGLSMIGIGKTREDFLSKLCLQNILPIEENVYKYSQKELKKPLDEKFIRDILTPEQIDAHIDFVLSKEPPETVYKIDIVAGDCIKNLYSLYTEDKAEQKEIIHLFDLYCKELPEAVAYVKENLKQHKCMQSANDFELKKILHFKVTMEELIRDDVADYRSWGLLASSS